MWFIMRIFIKFRRDGRGVTAIEYALIVALIAIAIVGAATSLSGGAVATFMTISNTL